jgi:peptidoglycan DL-endopeptidase CwlO
MLKEDIMKKSIPILLILSFLLSACNVFNRDKNYDFDTPSQKNQIAEDYKTEEDFIKEKSKQIEESDGLLTNPNILKQDDLIVVGDMNVGKDDPNFTIQHPPTEFEERMAQQMSNDQNKLGITKIHHNWKYPQLHPVFINPNVKPVNGSYIENAVNTAWNYYGTPYEYGSDRNNPKTFDCSDYTRWIHLYSLGMDLPSTSRSQWEYVKKFSKRQYTDLSKAKRGDLLFFMSYKGWREQDYNGINVKAQPIAHCGIYLGNGQMLHTASAKTGGVRVDKIAGSHLQYRFVGGGSVLN